MIAKQSFLLNSPAHKLRDALLKREISSVELVRESLRQMRKLNDTTNAVITIYDDDVLEQAEVADDRIRGQSQPPGKLTGIPIILKDNLVTEGVRTTAGSKMLENYVPPYDATVVQKLKTEGAVIVGKANMDEFAMGSSNETSRFGAVLNPWNTETVPGGSSGGSAAAVASCVAPLALGSDTGGSVRQPAALCGVVGMKPSYGVVSRYGLIAFASSLDQIGPFARDVRDCADLLNIIAGKDANDATSVEPPVDDFAAALTDSIDGVKLGVPKEYAAMLADKGVETAFDEAVAELSSLGCEVKEISLKSTPYVLATYYIIAPAEASSNLSRFDGIKYGLSANGDHANEVTAETRTEGFGAEVKRRLFMGGYCLSVGHYDAYYKRSMDLRQTIAREMDAVFKEVDLIVTPTSLTPAFKIGERVDDPHSMYSSDFCTIVANIAGLPAISVPCGMANKLPVGLQIIGPRMADDRVLNLAYAFQEATAWHTMHPKLTS